MLYAELVPEALYPLPELESKTEYMQYSNFGLTRPLNILIMVSLSRETVCLLVIPSVIFAFFTTLTHCFDGFKSLEIITPRSDSSETDYNTSLSMM